MPERIIIAFDFGMKYIGVACGQSITCTAQPLSTIVVGKGEIPWHEILTLIKTWEATDCVVGIPVMVSGKEQRITKHARAFVSELAKKTGLPVHGVDERLTTKEARAQLFESGGFKKLKKIEIDSFVAKLLAEQWLGENQ